MPGDVDDLVEARLRKLEGVRAAGHDPFPRTYERTHLSQEVIAEFSQLEEAAVRVAGRLVGGIRDLGGAAFIHLQDGAGRIQVYLKRDLLGDTGFALYHLLDIGDFVGVEGRPFRTRTGEVTIEAAGLTFLAKSLRPLPEKWHGLTDVEKRYRQRYLDLIANEDVRQVFLLRSQVIGSIRRFLDSRGFLEVETPVLQPVASGAAARPFQTSSNALGGDFYLRIALELHLKRCVIGGMERVYEIGRIFRNEGLSTRHNPEFTMLEAYQAYADYRDIMRLLEELVAAVSQEVLGTTRVQWGDNVIDLAPPWQRKRLRDLLIEYTGIDYAEWPDDASALEAAARSGLPVEPDWNRAKIIDELMSALVAPHLLQPTFVMDYPIETTPLAKRRAESPDEVERFEPYVAGMEIGNAFSELNDPVEQRLRFEEQVRQRALGDQEAQALDEEFLEAMEYGMPPTGGLGLGIDRLVMILANRRSIREVILFPQMRPRSGK